MTEIGNAVLCGMLESENADVAVGRMMQCATVIMPMWLCTV